MKNIQPFFIILILLASMVSCSWFGDINDGYPSEQVQFSSGDFEVHGELLLPDEDGKFPLVIMVHGSGPAYHTYFHKIKESFMKAGYATLMWDKPGFGKSTGKFTEEHLRAERAEILIDAIDKMKQHPKIQGNKIGVWGISQAGYVIPMALEKTNDISFMILVGVGGENGIRQTAFLIQEQLKCDGVSEKDAMQAAQNFTGLFYATTYNEYLKCAQPLVDDQRIRKLNFVSAIWPEDQWKPYQGTEEGFYDPIPVIEKTSIPTLVFFGDLDKNVNPVQGMEAYNAALKKAGNTDFKVELIEDTDHNIIISETGCTSERRARSGKGWSNYDPRYLRMMEEWLKDL
nr:alpha/beta hydrolase [Bacteroidota bacterium]